MKKILLVFFSVQLWRPQVDSKPALKSSGLGAQPPNNPENNTQSNKNEIRMPNRREFYQKFPPLKFRPTAALPYGAVVRDDDADKTTASTTTRVYLDNDCDYVNYYCMRGYYTGHICARTIYNLYETFDSYCQLEYVNCMENYELWTIAHMGVCYNVSSYKTFAYYAYAIWDNEQLEELYVLPSN